ncbi:MAG: cation diffusion facilitator family transporter [Thermoguttaceae bacterium]
MDSFHSCPSHSVSNSNMQAIRRITWIGLWTNLVLSVIKFVAGIFGHSSVLIADAVHSLSDLLTDFAVIIGAKFWSRPADDEHPYGHAKIETLVTFLIGFALILVAFELLNEAVGSLFTLSQSSEQPAPTVLALIAALISIVVKEYLYRITVRIGMQIKSTAVIANAWHHRSDALSSIPAALAVGTCILLGPKYTFLDPVGTIVVSLMIVHAAWNIIRPTFLAMLDAGVSREERDEMEAIVRTMQGVCDLHKLRTRRVGPTGIAVDLHVQVPGDMTVIEAHLLSHEIQTQLLQSQKEIVEVFVHIEPVGDAGNSELIHD